MLSVLFHRESPVKMCRPLLAVFAAGCLVAGAARAADDTFDSDGVKIRYVTEGEGEAVVLIHGWMSDSGMWGKGKDGETKLDTKDAPGFRAIALDCRGHGKSDKPHDQKKYGAAMADDVVRLLDHLKIKKAHLVGYSSGAFIAGKLAATHPDRVLSVVYAGQAPLVVEARGKPTGEPSEVEVFAKAVEEGKGLGAYLMAVWPADKPKPTQEQADLLAKILYGGKDHKAFAAAGLSFGELEVTEEQLKKCKAPILFVHGANESDLVKDRVKRVHKLLDRGEVKTIVGGDHVTTLAKPEFATTINDFLKANKTK